MMTIKEVRAVLAGTRVTVERAGNCYLFKFPVGKDFKAWALTVKETTPELIKETHRSNMIQALRYLRSLQQ